MALHKTTCSIENVMTEILSIDTVVVDVIFLLGKKKKKIQNLPSYYLSSIICQWRANMVMV